MRITSEAGHVRRRVARTGTRVKYSASAIYRTRKILYFVDISNTEILHMDS